MLKPSKTTSPNKLFVNDCVTLYIYDTNPGNIMYCFYVFRYKEGELETDLTKKKKICRKLGSTLSD